VWCALVDKGKPEVSGQHALAVPKVTSGHGSETEGVDDILDAVVRTATKKSSDQQPRDRLRARNVDRKSCSYLSAFQARLYNNNNIIIINNTKFIKCHKCL